ncbi:MAG: hypothetical protein EA394_09785 [Bacteroidia bacterium]|nr:MAG: hypothetical protein EA394_09785 [Bacteroidia bacterium]
MMKNFLFVLAGMLVVLFAHGVAFAQISGESEPFTFDTRDVTPFPVSYLALAITISLVAIFLILRYYREKSPSSFPSSQ